MVYISNGNIRMSFPTFSILADVTCPGSTPLCRKFCYAKKAERQYPNVRLSRTKNLACIKTAGFVADTIAELSKRKFECMRIHESGDFTSQAYLNKWFKICRALPQKKFLVYTQNYKLNFSKSPPNLVLYYTVWPDSQSVPNGLKAYVVDNGKGKIPQYIVPKAHVCQKGHTIDKCDECVWCYEGKGDVIFMLH
jgi:hypothetical protein